jgi:hypothetical protein
MASVEMGNAIAIIHGLGKAVDRPCVQTIVVHMVSVWMVCVSVMMAGWALIAQKDHVQETL